MTVPEAGGWRTIEGAWLSAEAAQNHRPLTIDHRTSSIFEVHTHGGRTPTGLEAVSWARQVIERGAGEIVLTSMDADGTKAGYDIELTRQAGEAIDVPLVASGGCGSPAHIRDVLAQTRADAALAASIFHYGQYTIAETKQYLTEQGVRVRPAAEAATSPQR
jgi:cyclase